MNEPQRLKWLINALGYNYTTAGAIVGLSFSTIQRYTLITPETAYPPRTRVVAELEALFQLASLRGISPNMTYTPEMKYMKRLLRDRSSVCLLYTSPSPRD